MLLRKLVAAFAPLLICAAVCLVFRWIDGLLGSGSFWAFVLKGLLLGAALAVSLPAAGVKAHTNGLAGWMLAGAAVLCAVLIYQYLESAGTLHVPVLRSILGLNGQVVLVESAAAGYLTAAGLIYRRR